MTAAGPAYEARNDTNHRLSLIRRALPPEPGRALDLGAGAGWFTRELIDQGWNVTAIDTITKHITYLQDKATIIERALTLSDISELMAHPWDLVAAMNFLHHTDDPRAVLELILGSNAQTILIQIPDRIEQGNQAVAGSHYLAPLYDITMARRPSVLGWSSTSLTKCARRPVLAWDPDLTVGTVVAGGGYTTRQWPDVGQHVAAALDLELTVGSLNLELESPWLLEYNLRPILDTRWGRVQGVEVYAAGVPAWAIKMPDSDRGPLFTEIMAVDHLREALELNNGDRVPLRLRGRG